MDEVKVWIALVTLMLVACGGLVPEEGVQAVDAGTQTCEAPTYITTSWDAGFDSGECSVFIQRGPGAYHGCLTFFRCPDYDIGTCPVGFHPSYVAEGAEYCCVCDGAE